jgi:hypothetical protein
MAEVSLETVLCVADNQNITESLPRDLLRRVKRLAVDRPTSVSALIGEARKRLADEDRRYSAARKRALAALNAAVSLDTGGHRAWSRDDRDERGRVTERPSARSVQELD